MINYNSDVGRLRLRVADIGDLPFLPDEVYEQTLADNDGNLTRTAKDIACMILGILSLKGHRKLAGRLTNIKSFYSSQQTTLRICQSHHYLTLVVKVKLIL
jgi:hypothetical protein